MIGATYDAAGYQLSGPNGGTLSYDGYGRMTFASVGGHSVTEEYSPRQERVLVKDQSSSGTGQTVYFWGAGREPIDLLFYRDQDAIRMRFRRVSKKREECNK